MNLQPVPAAPSAAAANFDLASETPGRAVAVFPGV